MVALKADFRAAVQALGVFVHSLQCAIAQQLPSIEQIS